MRAITTCPTCGSKRMRRVCRDVTRDWHGKKYTVPRLSFEECPDCGEVLYDLEAMGKIEEYSPAYTKLRAHRPKAVGRAAARTA